MNDEESGGCRPPYAGTCEYGDMIAEAPKDDEHPHGGAPGGMGGMGGMDM